jgi:cephalosporin hydroxylase
MVIPSDYVPDDPPAAGQHGSDVYDHARLFVDMAPHIDTLIDLAKGASVILELGVRTGVSTWAFLTGMSKIGFLLGVDFDQRIVADNWLPPQVIDDSRFMFIEGSDTDPELVATYPFEPDIVMIDTSHTFDQTLAELAIADSIQAKTIILHDYALPDVRDAVNGFLDCASYDVSLVEQSQWGLVVLSRT